MYKKFSAVALVLALSLVPVAAFADSTVIATADSGSSISPAGTVIVSTGDTQTFSIGSQSGFHLTDVSVDGVDQGAAESVDFTGIASDLTTHTISAFSALNAPTGGAMPWCSSPSAPGWNVSLPGGGCGGVEIYLTKGQTGTVAGAPYLCEFENGCLLPQ